MSCSRAWRARKKRLGATSAVAMEPEVSSTSTTSTPSRSTFSRTMPHCGRARATHEARRPEQQEREPDPPPALARAADDARPERARHEAREPRRGRDARATPRGRPGGAGRAAPRATRARRRSRAAPHAGTTRRPAAHRSPAAARSAAASGEHGREELPVAPVGGDLDLGLLQRVDALEDLAQRRRVGPPGRTRRRCARRSASAGRVVDLHVGHDRLGHHRAGEGVAGSLTGIGTRPPRPTRMV